MFKLNKIVKSLGFIFGVVVLSFSLGYVVLAWTEPSQVPPGCTAGTPGCDAPIHAGSTGQIKTGNLQVNALSTGTLSGNALLVPNGNVGIGTNSPSSKLEIASEAVITPPATCKVTQEVAPAYDEVVISGGAGCTFADLGITDGSQIIVNAGLYVDARMITEKISDIPYKVRVQDTTGWINKSFTYTKKAQSVKIDGALVTDGMLSLNGDYEGIGGISIPTMDMTVGGGNDGMFSIRHKDRPGKSNLIMFQSETIGVPVALSIDVKGGTDGYVGLGGISPSHQLELSTNDAVKALGGTWGAPSDMRLKKNIQPITGALDKITKLQGVSFNWINPEEHGGLVDKQGGFIAQDVEKIFPGWVEESKAKEKDASLLNGDKEKNLTLPFEYDAYVVEAIKELKTENDSLRQKNESLEKRLENLEKIVSSIGNK